MQAIFQYDQNPATSPEQIRSFVAEQLNFPELEAFAIGLIEGVRSQRNSIDDAISQAATNWKIERMATVDRAVLRLGTYEMLFAPNAPPPKVVITEAVEIAKRFSTNDSARFVNGVLDRLARLRSENSPSESSDVVESPTEDALADDDEPDDEMDDFEDGDSLSDS